MINNDGFTLLEIVVSVAALSLMSVFILQMFLASSNLNERAKNADIAISRSISEIENLKKYKSLQDYQNSLSNYLDTSDAYWDYTYNDDGSVKILLYYDEEWNHIKSNDSAVSNIKFLLQMYISPERASLYNVEINVDEVSNQKENRSLATFTTKKYFPKNHTAVVQS